MDKIPCWLYKKDEQPYLVYTEDEKEILEKDGWVDSPAKYGVETHPGKRLPAQVAPKKVMPEIPMKKKTREL